MSQKTEFPRGWDEERVRRVLEHYESQSESAAVAEDEAAYEERVVEPVAYPAEEIEWNRRLTVAGLQSQSPGWSWDGAEIPTRKPAFGGIVPVRSGGYWVRREGASRKVSDCTEDRSPPSSRAKLASRRAGSPR